MIEFAIVVPSYNNEYWVMQNLGSVMEQTYPHWFLYYINDGSMDSTGEMADLCAMMSALEGKCKIIHNQTRKGSLTNFYNVIHELDPHKVVVCLDGDDTFANPQVLEKLAAIYQDPTIWLTYGSFKTEPALKQLIHKPYGEEVFKTNSFRKEPFLAVHLKSFYAKLFQLIKKEDLMSGDAFYPVCGDLAFMMPMLEMASEGHAKFIEEILYVYNALNPIGDAKMEQELSESTTAHIKSLPPYKPLKTLF